MSTCSVDTGGGRGSGSFRYGVIPVSVKYVWSSTLPVGSAVRREGIGRPWVVAVSPSLYREDSLG